MLRVMAEVLADDTSKYAKFDCTYYIDEADEVDIVDLVESGCQGDLEAGMVAIFMKDYDDGVECVLDHCRKQKCGFTVMVDMEELFEYLGAKRPDTASLLASIGYCYG